MAPIILRRFQDEGVEGFRVSGGKGMVWFETDVRAFPKFRDSVLVGIQKGYTYFGKPETPIPTLRHWEQPRRPQTPKP